MTQSLDGFTAVSREDTIRILNEQVSACRQKIDDVICALEGEELSPKWSEVIASLRQAFPHLSTTDWAEAQNKLENIVAPITLPGGKTKADSALTIVREDIKEVVGILRSFAEPYYRMEAIEIAESYNRQFEHLLRAYKERLDAVKKQLNKIEIADLELFSASVLKASPDRVRAYAGPYDYWVIDEFQDTSPLQVELLSELIGDKPYYIVGDPQQSIYLFRGARSEVFSRAIDGVRNNARRI